MEEGTILWRQGDASLCAVLLAHGKLLHTLEEEAGTTEEIQVREAHRRKRVLDGHLLLILEMHVR